MIRKVINSERGEEMIKIISNLMSESDKVTVLEYECVKMAACNAIKAIKNELPEEAQTLETMEIVISEISKILKERKLVL